jgi:hypothetical protein
MRHAVDVDCCHMPPFYPKPPLSASPQRDRSPLLDQVLAGRIVPAVYGVRVIGHGGIVPDSIQGGAGAIIIGAAPNVGEEFG